MEMFGTILFWLGLLTGAVGGIWLLVVAFEESVLWGLGCLFIPIVGLVFAIMNWDTAGKPFLVQLAGAIIMGVGSVMVGMAG